MNLMVRILSATAVAFVLAFLFGGSSSAWDDAYRDALLRVKDPIPVSRELLLVSDGKPAAQPEDVADLGPVELLWTLTELGAERVLLPTSWHAEGLSIRETSAINSEVTSRLDEEFARIDENIAELFEAIRIGSIEPREADRFVDELRQLVANSNARIQGGLGPDSGVPRVSVEDIIERFGSDRVATELSAMGVSLPSYSAAQAIPVVPREERGDEQFRRLPHAALERYLTLANHVTARLLVLEEAGYFDETDPRKRPSIMRDNLRSLRRELYEQPSERRLAAWRDARDEYFQTVAGLIDEDTQAQLAERLERLEEEEDLEDDSAAQIEEMQQELANSFAAVREEYAELSAARRELAQEVRGSLVILEDSSGTEAEARAAVANSVLQGDHLYAPTGWDRTLLLIAGGLLVGIILAPFRLGAAVALWPVALGLGTAPFVALFVVADIWVAPVAVAVVLLGATGAVTLATGLSQRSAERSITGRATDRLPSRRLRRTILRGGLRENNTGRRRVAVVVVVPEATGAAAPAVLMSFHRTISRKLRKHGGIVFGEEGLTVFAAFDMRHPGEDHRLVQDVCTAVQELVSTTLPAGTPVRCGVEIGELAFYVSPIGGYRATGRTITYARRLSELARKHRLRALFGDSVVTAHDDGRAAETWRFREQGKLVVSSAGERYPFYRLTEIDRPSP